ncbi:B12-binding domain-containing radical SAM protein [Streptomyces atratus]|uniref:B12-binding domain-containing radical SAM protein n=1 Tax=Streptomyces atratus TaxID=1893 RepID=UPI003799DC51
MKAAPVHLIFPPMVETNFGSLYPASAVLAGYLESIDIATSQEDLNERFAEYLLTPEITSRLANGSIEGVFTDSLCAAAARWSQQNRNLLINEEGKHCFNREDRYGWVMEMLAQPFSINSEEMTQEEGRDVTAFEFYEKFYTWEGVERKITGKTKLVGISVAMGPQLAPALILSSMLKSAHPQLRIVLGGAVLSLMQPSDLSLLLKSNSAIDCVVRYDGEQPLAELAQQAITNEWNPTKVPGVSVIDEGALLQVAPAPGPNLNSLPLPKYSREALAKLTNPTLSITQARGCYWGKCDYCDFVELYGGSQPFRGRHPKGFADEIETLVRDFSIRRFNLVTESIPPAFARRLSTELLERNIDVRWNSFAMVDRRFDRELLELMVQAGCELLVIGLETMVTRVLKLVHKSADREENIRFLRDAHEAGMRLCVNLIPDLPSTTYEEAMSALRDMESLSGYVDMVSVFPFEATRSSKIGRSPEEFGLLSLAESDAVGQSQYALNHLHNKDPAMTDSQRQEVYRRYQGFARKINTRNDDNEFQPADALRPGALLRVPVEQLDVHTVGDSMVLTHMGARTRVTLPLVAAKILQPYLSGDPFSMNQFQANGKPAGPDMLGQFLRARVLAPLDHES